MPDESAESTASATSTTSASSTSSGSVTNTSSTTSTPSTTAEPMPMQEPTRVEQAAQVEKPTPAEAAEAYIVECFGIPPGIQSRMSDGSVIYTEYCFEQLGGYEYLEAESWANSPDNPARAQYVEDQEPVAKTPSPWVQGQIDWQDCLDAGNSDEYCRETLN